MIDVQVQVFNNGEPQLPLLLVHEAPTKSSVFWVLHNVKLQLLFFLSKMTVTDWQ